MARGETTPPRRAHFDEADSGQSREDRGPRRLSYPCRAHHCPMPGTIFPGGADSGICAWHFGANGDEIPKITRVILDWQVIADTINDARRFSNDPERAGNVKAQNEAFAAAWGRLVPVFAGSGWKQRLTPRPRELYGEWAHRLERFLRNRVKETVMGMVIADDDAPTPTVADMRSRVRGSLSAPITGEFA